MKTSRFSLLIAVVLFVSPIALVANEDQNQSTSSEQTTSQTENLSTATTTIDAKKVGMLTAITAALTAGKDNVAKGMDKVAAYSFDIVLKKLVANVKYLQGSKLENNIPTINRVLVGATALAIAYSVYKMCKTEQASNDDIDFDDLERDLDSL